MAELCGAFAGGEIVDRLFSRADRLRCRGCVGILPRAAALSPALMVNRQTPRHPDEPCAKPITVPKLPETAVRLDERVLRDVFGILSMAEDAVRHPERQRRGFGQPGFEFVLDVLGLAHEAAEMPVCEAIHPVTLSKTPPAVQGFSVSKPMWCPL